MSRSPSRRPFAHFLAIAALAIFVGISPAAADHVDPVFVPGNPDCQDLGFVFGFKPQPEPPPSGTYFFGDPVTVPAHPPTGDSVTITSDGSFFDWTSTLALDAVIVKGGPNANVYLYSPEETADTGLHSPINPNNNQPFAVSHIELCYDFEVTVSKTAETAFTRTFEWDVDKSVTPSTWELFAGDSGTSKYTVAVTKTGFTDSGWTVSGEIWIANETPFDATIESVADAISGFGPVAVDCGVGFPYALAAGDSLHCSYATPLPDGASRTNTATVVTGGLVGGGEAEAEVVFGAPTTVVNDTVHVDDTNGSSWQFSDSGVEMYTRTFACGGDQGTHHNLATIRETGQSDGATVLVGCHVLGVEKTAETSYTRTWTWTIEKSASETELVLSPGQIFLVDYWVEVGATSADSAHQVTGEIWIDNPNPSRAASLAGVSDLVSPGIAANVDCPASTVPAGGSLHCTYSADLPDGADRANTATATLQNFDYDPLGNGTPGGTTDFSGGAAVVFGDPSEEIDECVEVEDTHVGVLGAVCAAQAPHGFHYQFEVGPFQDPDDCGEQTVDNTASFVADDTGTTGEDTWTIHVFVPCDEGCTLTPGYWKTHSREGPAPYDDTWALLDPLQEDAPFFSSGQTYYEVLWTPPAGGNAYYILARAYIAAELNLLNGASMPADELEAFSEATDLLAGSTPDQVAKLKGKKRAVWLGWAYILDAYNNGLTGPGHCSE